MILTNDNLPFVDTHSSRLDAMRIKYCTPEYFITDNGDLCVFLEMVKFNFGDVMSCVRILEPNTTLQIYKLRDSGNYKYFLCITCRMNYQYFTTKWLQIFDSINGPVKKMNQFIRDSVEKIEKLKGINSDNLVRADVLSSTIMSYLWSRGNFPRSNCGVIRVSSNQYISSFSINNPGSLPLTSEIFSTIDSYLQVTTIVRPTAEREMKIKNLALEKALIISMLSDEEDTDELNNAHVHTVDCSNNNLISSLQGTIFYVNTKYLFNRQSVSTLNEVYSQCQTILSEHGIVAYNHTITGGNEYVAALPGNGYNGEHYHVIMQSTFGPLLNRILSL
jgi:hypothetical protein